MDKLRGFCCCLPCCRQEQAEDDTRPMGDTYTQLDVLAASPVTQPPQVTQGSRKSSKEARYPVGATLVRNMQDPSVAFKFGGDVGTIQGPESVGAVITIEDVYTDEKGDLKYRIANAKASCKVTILEKHFDRRPSSSSFQLGEPVMRNSTDKKMEFNMKGSLGIVRPGTTSTVAAVFVDKDGSVKYTLKGAVNWLPEDKFERYFTSVQGEQEPRRDSQASYRKSLTEEGSQPLLPSGVDQGVLLAS
eukprot:TRINITY_DN32613_c0_g1_i1.p1 TRINITY_DN32613_c0_g1~~TRINITY_DN32613_c0_g1_i1.p1  ORF type:complete len:246 (+),score=85.68 TRINITY_DN32613_c0_g1_i1:635-1372(+)